jgi:hypothetical protein
VAELQKHRLLTCADRSREKKRPQAGEADETVCPTEPLKNLLTYAHSRSPHPKFLSKTGYVGLSMWVFSRKRLRQPA